MELTSEYDSDKQRRKEAMNRIRRNQRERAKEQTDLATQSEKDPESIMSRSEIKCWARQLLRSSWSKVTKTTTKWKRNLTMDVDAKFSDFYY